VLPVSQFNVLSADHDSPPCWSAALSRALCLIHKQQGTSASPRTEGSKPRILCINGSPDVPAQYIATMNAIFSAQVLNTRSVVSAQKLVYSIVRFARSLHAAAVALCWKVTSYCSGQGFLVALLRGMHSPDPVTSHETKGS